MSVWLVRHAKSAPDPTAPSHTWGLSDEGKAQARRLRIDGPTRLIAGPEPRMASTLIHLGPVEVDARFAESHVDGWLGEAAFLDAVRRYHAGDPLPGWEAAAAVVERFELVDGAAICSGGRAISAVIAHHAGGDGFDIWRSLRMPDVITLFRDKGDRWVASTASE